MARKGIRGATIRYMETELEPQIEMLQKEIPILQEEERKQHHLLAMVNTISSRLKIDKTNDPEWFRLLSQYDSVVARLILAKEREAELIREYNLLVDVLDNKFSRQQSRDIIKNSLWNPSQMKRTTSPPSKGGSRRRRRGKKRRTRRH